MQEYENKYFSRLEEDRVSGKCDTGGQIAQSIEHPRIPGSSPGAAVHLLILCHLLEVSCGIFRILLCLSWFLHTCKSLRY